MTTLRHQLLDTDGKPVIGQVATVAIYNPQVVRQGVYSRSKAIAAVSDDNGWLTWELPPVTLDGGQTEPIYVVTGIESSQVLVAIPMDVTTTLISVTRVGILSGPPPSSTLDLVTQGELNDALAEVINNVASVAPANGSVITSALASGAVSTGKIAGKAVTFAKLADDVPTSLAADTSIRAGAVSAVQAAIAAGTITVGSSAPNSITPQMLNFDPATQAELDAASTADRNRVNHTGTQTAATISDLTEAVQDIVGAFFGAGTGVSVTYNDAQNSITVSATGGTADPELIRDTIGAALIGVGPITITVNDAADTITFSTTATANSTDAQLRDRTTHTGVEPYTALPAGTTLTVVKAGSSWPARPTSRTDLIVAWKGADPSPAIVASGTGGMIDGVDYRLVTP